MKTTELFVEQTLTGFLVLTAAAAPFLSWDTLEKLPDEAQGGVDISSAAGAIGVAPGRLPGRARQHEGGGGARVLAGGVFAGSGARADPAR